ncbi:MAG: retention module-containing protein, partial [Gammaproteobacteria bacterium]|nr:retention module-containing protein [Gammaproteobacteria bacterium]
MATKSIGYVAELIGDAQVRSVDGVIRVLSIGDQINEGDILTTGLNTQIVLEFYNGNKLQVGENTEMLLDESVFAGLSDYPESRVDQLAELQSLIVEGIDLAELEATAAGAAGDSDALHQASVYSRDGNEGIVETRLTPFDLGSAGPDNQSPLEDAVIIPTADTQTVSAVSDTSAPNVSIAVDNITADDIISATETAGMINVTGNVGGFATTGDSIDLNVNGTAYSGTVSAVNTFSIPVAAADLMVDTSFDATVSGIDGAGNPYSATTTSTHTVDTTATASITLDANITPDDIIDAAEAAGTVSITGSVAGDFQAGDIVTLTINGVSASGGVLADGSFSIDVNGSDLRNDPDATIDASFIATDAAGNVAAPVTDTESYTVNTAPNAIVDVGALDGAEDTTTASLNATLLANDSDPEGDPISITAINGTALVGGVQSIAVTNGTVNIDASDNITFTPAANYNGPVSFDYTLSDGSLTNTATVSGTISAVNDTANISVTPVDTAVTEDDGANQTASGTIAISDVDNGEGTLDTSTANYGTVTVDGSGDWTYTLDNNDPVVDALADGETLVDTITFTSDDGTTATQAITITGTNDAAT